LLLPARGWLAVGHPHLSPALADAWRSVGDLLKRSGQSFEELHNLRMFEIKRLNHAVMYVRNAERAARFYQEVLGFAVYQHMGDRAYFLRTSASTDNNHDLGLFSVGEAAGEPTRGERVGLYHLAWQVETLPELAEVRDALLRANALVGVNDHGSSLSLYAQDPDGNEFEVMWQVPAAEWATRKGGHLDIEGEMRKRGLAPLSTV
jgi:catechol-2,3-dioxygenase